MPVSLGRWVIALDGNEIPSRETIGGKAWSIARMLHLGLPVPPATVITTDACASFLDNGEFPSSLNEEVDRAVEWLETASGRTFGHSAAPLLVSVRSGAAISMPGMMDTVLNLGISDETEQALAQESGDPAFARDTHRRFLELYASVVLKIALEPLDATQDSALWRERIVAAGGTIPHDPRDQLRAAIMAVFESCNSRRAKRYRKHHNLPDNLGTAVTIQCMVFGNLDEQSGTGVLFSRNPLNGEPTPYGEYLGRAQGEDVVSGKFTPAPLSALKKSAPKVYDELLLGTAALERDAGDVQDIEFTVQQGKLFMLQSRAAKRAPRAAVRFAVDMVREGVIDRETALSRVSAEQVRTLLQPRLADGASDSATVIAEGEPACQGVGSGTIVTNADDAEAAAAQGKSVVLARPTTSPEDVHGMIAARAVITDQGGSTSHAAVVSRALGVPCIVGCGEGAVERLVGCDVTVDGNTGKIFDGVLSVDTPDESDDSELNELTQWARSLCAIEVINNRAERPAGTVDLNTLSGGEDTAQIPHLIGNAKSVAGRAMDTDEGVIAALDCGVECIASEHVLPTLLCALVHARSVCAS